LKIFGRCENGEVASVKGSFLYFRPFSCYILYMTITQTVEIPANRRVHLDFEVPREVPEGRTNIILQFPDRKEIKASKPVLNNGKIKYTRKELDEMLKDCPITQSLIGILHTDMTVDEIRDERLARHLK